MTAEPTNRARLEGLKPDGSYKWCVYPCQKLDADGRKIARTCRVAVDLAFAGKVWTVSGPPEAPTLSPSIDCQDTPCWHGFVVEGEVR